MTLVLYSHLIVYDMDKPFNVILAEDSLLDTICTNYNVTSNSARSMIQLILNDSNTVYINEENYPKIKALYKSGQEDLLRELYHTLKAEESIVDRENRIMELNNKITGIDESIKE